MVYDLPSDTGVVGSGLDQNQTWLTEVVRNATITLSNREIVMKTEDDKAALQRIKDELASRAGTDDVPAVYSKRAAEWILDLQKTLRVAFDFSLKMDKKLKKLRKAAAVKK